MTGSLKGDLLATISSYTFTGEGSPEVVAAAEIELRRVVRGALSVR